MPGLTSGCLRPPQLTFAPLWPTYALWVCTRLRLLSFRLGPMQPVSGHHDDRDRARRDAIMDLVDLVELIRLVSCSAPAQLRAACSEGRLGTWEVSLPRARRVC